MAATTVGEVVTEKANNLLKRLAEWFPEFAQRHRLSEFKLTEILTYSLVEECVIPYQDLEEARLETIFSHVFRVLAGLQPGPKPDPNECLALLEGLEPARRELLNQYVDFFCKFLG